MRRAWRIVAAVFALVLGGVAVASAPDGTATVAPLYVDGVVGEAVSGRRLTSTVTGVRLAEELVIPYREDVGDTTTDGVWVIVDATITIRQQYTVLTSTDLRIGDRVFRVSDVTPAPSLLAPPESSGIPQHGSLVFEIPLSALDDPGASRAQVLFNPGAETRLDSVAAIVVDLASLEILPSTRIDPATVEEH